MARVPGKHGRDQPLDFQGFLNDLQDWELSLHHNAIKDKKIKPQPSPQKNSEFDAINIISSSFTSDQGTVVDATSEKELGNEYFKQKKFDEAIECYSRSIAFSPTAVAYANRAMAYLKIRLFREAEDDCTEALNLDDRYIKAYSRRATARKESGKYRESIEDSEFALRLEPNNQEIKKQYAEVKSLYEKEILQKASGVIKGSVQGTQKGGRSDTKVSSPAISFASSSNQRTGKSMNQKDKNKESGREVSAKKSSSVEEINVISSRAGNKTEGGLANGSHAKNVQEHNRSRKQELKASVQELASRAASRAMSEAAKNITPPSSAYQFEVSWQSFSGDCSLQAQLLKATSPSALPHVFKNALSAPMLIDIVKCVATFFVDDMKLAVNYLENLTQVPRFSLLIMCLSAADKTDLRKLWDGVFCSEATPIEYAEILDNLRSKYCLN